MVGVPGRSKACHTCKQRHMRCDGERPTCRNCDRSSRICTGYQRKRAFVLSKDVEAGRKTLIDEADSGTIVFARWRINHNKPSSAKTGPDSQVSWRRRQDNSSVSPTPIITPRYALRDQLLASFLGIYLPVGILDRRARPPDRAKQFFLQLSDVPDISPALEAATLAVCMAKLGRHNGQKDLCYGSLQHYTKSLHCLQRAIQCPKSRWQDQTLGACLMLSMYEFTESPGECVRGCMVHLDGALRLLRLRGPAAHATGLAHSTFCALRSYAAFQSIAQHVPTFLSLPEWRELPYSSCKKGLYDELLDILLDLSTSPASPDSAVGQEDLQERLAQTLAITRRDWRVDGDLERWRARFEASICGPLYWPEFSTVDSAADNPALGKLFPVTFRFPSFAVAQAMQTYWAAQIAVRHRLSELYSQLRDIAARAARLGDVPPCTCDGGREEAHSSTMETAAAICLSHSAPDVLVPPRQLHRLESKETVARKICQSVEYTLQDSMGSLGYMVTVPPLVTVLAYSQAFDEDWSRERVWIGEVIARIQARGYRVE